MERIKFDVSGQLFAINRNLLLAGPDSKLKDLCYSDDSEVILDRPVDVFGAILAMYQTGQLHIPKTCCPGTFLLELEHWGINPHRVETCCFFRLQRFMIHQESLKKFSNNMQLALEGEKRTRPTAFPTLNRIKDKIWSVVDFKHRTVLSTLYFTVSLFMVLISVCNLAFSTDPNFRRNMTNCERYEFMKKYNMDDLDLVADMLKADCGNTTGEANTTTVTPPPLIHVNDDSDYDFVELIIEKPPENEVESTTPCIPQEPFAESIPGENGSYPMNSTTTILCQIRFSDLPFYVPSFHLKRIKIPNFKIPTDTVQLIELLTTIYFTVDIFLRLLSCPLLSRYFLSVVNVADALALLGAYISWILVLVRPKEQYEENWLDLINYLQMLRSFRLFRLVMTFNISKVLMYSVEQSLKDGFIMVLVLIAGMCTFSTCIYLSEDKLSVPTIPDAWYWSIITMTTVGYGDITPKTPVGRLVACLCSICGLLVFSLTVPLFVNQFLTLYQYADMELPDEDWKTERKEVQELIIMVDEPENAKGRSINTK